MDKYRILLAEDDPNLGKLLCDYLEMKGYAVTLATNGKEAFDLFSKKDYDLCILDVMMPVKDGITLAREIRAINATLPVVFLTAKSMKEDTLEGFKAGADDYITKPFSMEELLMRIAAILRRTHPAALSETAPETFDIGNYRFDRRRQLLVFQNKREQKLTTREADLLKLLCLNRNNVLDRNYALKAIWKDDNYFNSRSMDVYIAKLRKHLKDDPAIEIVNVHGKGFRLLTGK